MNSCVSLTKLEMDSLRTPPKYILAVYETRFEHAFIHRIHISVKRQKHGLLRTLI